MEKMKLQLSGLKALNNQTQLGLWLEQLHKTFGEKAEEAAKLGLKLVPGEIKYAQEPVPGGTKYVATLEYHTEIMGEWTGGEDVPG